MTDIVKNLESDKNVPQCHYFVVRKKRLCRMTVRPGRQYCGEHEPKPKTEEGQDDTRIPCPNDPKHTCYASKLEKHLTICNAKLTEQPPFIIHNINAPTDNDACVRKPLSEIPKETLIRVINKVNSLYEKHVQGNITQVSERPIHPAVVSEFCEGDRTESSRRHMRQASSILHMMEDAGLVKDRTCYVELGAGKGQLSYYMGVSWCDATTNSKVVVVDRAALRHKRDNKLLCRGARIRADLAHLALSRVGVVEGSVAVVGCAKHLCGVATDYALRCITCDDVLGRVSGVVLATCCHHRCERAGYLANKQLQELGIDGDEFNTMLGIVSWATCGDGLSRERRRRQKAEQTNIQTEDNIEQRPDNVSEITEITVLKDNTQEISNSQEVNNRKRTVTEEGNNIQDEITEENNENFTSLGDSRRERDSITNINTKQANPVLANRQERDSTIDATNETLTLKNNRQEIINIGTKEDNRKDRDNTTEIDNGASKLEENNRQERDSITENNTTALERDDYTENNNQKREANEFNEECLSNPKWRESVGRRAKALVDWGRLLYLRDKGFDTRLCYYVPASVSPENVCILATKIVNN